MAAAAAAATTGAEAASREAFRSYLERAGVVDALTKGARF
jgi:hypothetical protein